MITRTRTDKNLQIEIRLEEENDHRQVEELTREAFWNLYVPGCNEHLILHNLRQSDDFIPELDFVALYEGRIVGNIVFSRSKIVAPSGVEHPTITFGPVSVLPELHRRGIGTTLINHAIKAATAQGYKAVLIFGYPEYYARFGFRLARDFRITNPEGRYHAAHQVLELVPGTLDGISGRGIESADFNPDPAGLEEFDSTFPAKTKAEAESQKKFAAMLEAFLP